MLNEQSSSNSAENSSETADLLFDAVANGATLKDIKGIPDDVMEGLYAHAYDFYQQGRSQDAETFFRFLCLYDTYNADYAMGLAATLQQLKKYENAIDVYTLAFALGENDFRPMLHAGQCHLFLKNKQEAQNCFTAVVEGDATEPLKTKAQAYLAGLNITKPIADTTN